MKPKNPKPLSRRTVVVTAAATLTPGAGKSAAGPVLATSSVAEIGAQWRVARQAESALAVRWSDLETWLIDNVGWADLTDDEQKALPEALELHAIDAQLQQLDADRRQCQVALIRLPAASRDDLLVKLQIVADLLNPADHALAHRLLATAIEDLKPLA